MHWKQPAQGWTISTHRGTLHDDHDGVIGSIGRILPNHHNCEHFAFLKLDEVTSQKKSDWDAPNSPPSHKKKKKTVIVLVFADPSGSKKIQNKHFIYLKFIQAGCIYIRYFSMIQRIFFHSLTPRETLGWAGDGPLGRSAAWWPAVERFDLTFQTAFRTERLTVDSWCKPMVSHG